MKKVYIGILGLGVVGGGTYEIIRDNGAEIAKNYGIEIEVKRILERDAARGRALNVAEGVVTENINDIITDPEISIVVEVIGGVGAAREFNLAALRAGKSVVTANKELLAKHLPELEAEAKKTGAGLYYEASCMGGVPVVRTLSESMQANNVLSLMGIFNGTTNYILSKMAGEGMGYDAALKQAQRLGFAEQDPSADVEGFDTAYKLSILSGMAFHTAVPYDKIIRCGISNISKEDIQAANSMGYAVKLLAIGEKQGKALTARVNPAFVPLSHPLASVSDSFNAVFLKGDNVGDIMLYGRGAGARPTGSAVVSDIVKAAVTKKHRYSTFKNTGEIERGIKLNKDYQSRFYLRVQAEDKAGVLAKITAIFGAYRISISKMNQKGGDGAGFAPIMFLTHLTQEKDMLRAIERLSALECVGAVESVIHVCDSY